MASYQFAALSPQETKTDSTIVSWKFIKELRNDRTCNGGGVALYVMSLVTQHLSILFFRTLMVAD